MRIKLWAVAAVSLFATSVGVVEAPSSALASAPAGYLTLWDGCNGGSNPTAGECGGAWVLTASGGIGVCHALPTGAGGRVSAFANESGHNFRVWTGSSPCTGSSATLYSGTETGQIDAPFNNTIKYQQRIS
jgi:hypothetical protein